MKGVDMKRRQAPDADVVHGARTEAWVEVLCTQRFEVFNNPWPQMEDIIPEEKDKEGRR